MTRTEKRHFKVFASKHIIGEKNNYVRLFDAIEKQKEYNEAKIKKQFHKETFVRHLPSEKHYLYNLILDSLHIYHLNLSYDSRLRKQFSQVGILFQKGLYAQCRKLLEKTKSDAVVLEKYNYVYEAVHWEKRLFKVGAYGKANEQKVIDLFDTGNDALEQIRNIDDYLSLQERLIFLFNTHGEIRNKEQKKKYDIIMKHSLLKDESKAITPTGKRIFNNIYTIYNFAANDSATHTDKYVKRCLQLVESVPRQIKEDPNIYLAILTNFLTTCSQFKNYKEFIPAIEKMRNLPEKYNVRLSRTVEVKVFVNSYLFELDFYIITGSFEKIKSVAKNIEMGLEKYKNSINKGTERTLYYNIAYLYFGLGEYKKAVEWLNKILNEKDLDTKQDIICFAKILNLIAHYQLENTDLLPYTLKSTYRYLTKRNRIYKAESIILDIIKKLPDINSRQSLKDLYMEAKNSFSTIIDKPLEKNALRYFDFISWLTSKIENLSFAEVVRKTRHK